MAFNHHRIRHFADLGRQRFQQPFPLCRGIRPAGDEKQALLSLEQIDPQTLAGGADPDVPAEFRELRDAVQRLLDVFLEL